MAALRPGPVTRTTAWEVLGEGGARRGDDDVVTEEPLEIRLVVGNVTYPVAVTMRTPGSDFELAVGFVYNEGIVSRRAQVTRVSYCVDRSVAEEQRFNLVNVAVNGVDPASIARLERHFSMTSACGICGKATLDALQARGYAPLGEGPTLAAGTLRSLPAKLRAAQRLFDATGGAHASALFDASGELVAVREDVGRHNALDKLVGWALLDGRLPLAGHVVVVSSRASFELVQKSLSAGVSALCSVSAPSSLAVALAREHGLTLVGFLRPGRFQVYSGAARLQV